MPPRNFCDTMENTTASSKKHVIFPSTVGRLRIYSSMRYLIAGYARRDNARCILRWYRFTRSRLTTQRAVCSKHQFFFRFRSLPVFFFFFYIFNRIVHFGLKWPKVFFHSPSSFEIVSWTHRIVSSDRTLRCRGNITICVSW